MFHVFHVIHDFHVVHDCSCCFHVFMFLNVIMIFKCFIYVFHYLYGLPNPLTRVVGLFVYLRIWPFPLSFTNCSGYEDGAVDVKRGLK